MMYLLLTRFENAQIRGKIPLDARIHFNRRGKQNEAVRNLNLSLCQSSHRRTFTEAQLRETTLWRWTDLGESTAIEARPPAANT